MVRPDTPRLTHQTIPESSRQLIAHPMIVRYWKKPPYCLSARPKRRDASTDLRLNHLSRCEAAQPKEAVDHHACRAGVE